MNICWNAKCQEEKNGTAANCAGHGRDRGLLDEWRFATTLLILESVTFLMSYFHLLCASSFWMWLANLSLCTIANNASVSKTPALELWVTIDSFILSGDLWHDTVTHMNSDGGGIYKCKVLSNLLHSNCIVDILVSTIMTCLWAQTAEVKLYQ